MKGFFEIDIPKVIKPKVNRKAFGCEVCGLYKQVNSPKMPYTGEGQLKALMLGEAPGRNEDLQNKQFVGEAGDLLRETLIENGFELDRDFYKQNILGCRPTDKDGNNRPPTKEEIFSCEQQWRKNVEEINPRIIFLFGAKAVEAFFMGRSHPITSDLSIGRWNRQCIPDVQTGAWIIPLYHPSFAVRNVDFKPKFKQGLKWGLEQLKRESPEFMDWKKFCKPLTDFKEVIYFLRSILERQSEIEIAIDYETSGLRPYKQGHHIWTIGVSLIELEWPNYGYSFPYSYPNHWSDKQFDSIESLWKSILSEPKIPKVAQNIQMEESWGRRIVGVETQNWIHDTMICSHIINEHRKFTGLDFQVFINWGYEYGDDISPFKKPNEDGFNRMHEVPLKQLLEYNTSDALFTGMLYERQVEIIGE